MKHNQFWELKQSAESPDTLELYIYSTVESDHWWRESETSAAHFRDMLVQHKDAKEIKVYINSLGGSVMEGIAIYNQLKRHSAHKTVVIDGFACSIASVIAMAGDTVIMPKNTVMMIHNAWTIAMGNAKELRKAADDAGYDLGKIDGDFGIKTQRAVVCFQFEHSLEVDGIAGPKTRAALCF